MTVTYNEAAAGTGTLSGTPDPSGAAGVDLSAAGTADWAVWGYGSSLSGFSCLPNPVVNSGYIAPKVRKAGGEPDRPPGKRAGLRSIRRLLRSANPFSFNWSDGTVSAPSVSDAFVGVSHSSHDPGDEFRFSVPASASTQELEGVAVLRRRLGPAQRPPV